MWIVRLALRQPDTIAVVAILMVHFKVPGQLSTVIISVDTLLFRKEGLRVAVVQDRKAHLQKVTPGLDFGDRIEIVTGLVDNESVIVSPPDSIIEGEQGRIAQPSSRTNSP